MKTGRKSFTKFGLILALLFATVGITGCHPFYHHNSYYGSYDRGYSHHNYHHNRDYRGHGYKHKKRHHRHH